MPTRLISSVRGIGVARQREHVDVRLELLHRLLVLHAEALLLVDDEQAEVLELARRSLSRRWVPMTQSTSPDASPSMTSVAWAGGEEAAERLDPDRVAGEAVGERVAVLGGEQRRRREHGDLLAVLDRLERGADRDLGLAEADVAAHQAVHRVRPLHVGLDVGDRRALVGRLDVREGVLHLVPATACPGRTRSPRR